jgi:hypothetical protein
MTTLTVRPKNKKEAVILKKVLKALDVDFETSSNDESLYSPEFVNRILDKKKHGNFTTIDTADVWGSLGFK